jgi:DNA-binding IclR family transcriptional regulator
MSDRRFAMPARYVATGAIPVRYEEGSDVWIALEQMKHGPLTPAELAELLDVPRTIASKVIRDCTRYGYVRRLLESEAGAHQVPPTVPGDIMLRSERAQAVLAHLREHKGITSAVVARMFRVTIRKAHSLIGSWKRHGLLANGYHDTERDLTVYVLAESATSG